MNSGPLPTVLIVDDTPQNIALMTGLLKDNHLTRVATSGERALQAAMLAPLPDLILLDIMMPGMDGYEVCRRLKADPALQHIPVIFLTARTDAGDEQRGLDCGAADYITKPISPPIALARIRNHLALKTASDRLRHQNARLEAEVARRTHQIQQTQDATITALASLAEARDDETGNHIQRTQHYVKLLAQALRAHPRFADFLTGEVPDLLFKSAPLHDIGKVGIPDAILLKPGRLTPQEFEIMKTHTTLGRNAIAKAEQMMDEPSSFLRFAREIAESHQEKWDGSGYPRGLAGDTIPISARLMALADVYDALISRRVYKPAFTHEEAVRIVGEGSGTHFDPDIVAAFLAIHEDFRQVAMRFADDGGLPTDKH
ncbi:two-component system response regulator [Roseateles saccharophilus]|uniref:Putative two-component system response regulator n=1 Tax=Roseateles saccharophilus TaxID=304 RepID=A0A4R3UWE5_ROSSA|nr:two-component system response regulator [Roseateles saccharophilus]MDG0832749.1 two-component system response regulator [Roseateles saccharophilus]TCU95311.1 putative two-component system response regulator [Roseateles saccharophilus]